MNQQENDKHTGIEDLPVDAAQQDEVMGGNRDTEPVSGREVKVLLNTTF